MQVIEGETGKGTKRIQESMQKAISLEHEGDYNNIFVIYDVSFPNDTRAFCGRQ